MSGDTVPLTSKCVAEFIGTFLLVFTVGCNLLSGNAVWGGVSIGCVLMVVIYALGNISGGNFNPAVSVALGLSGKMEGGWATVGIYCFVQLLGGIVGAAGYFSLFGQVFNLEPAKGFAWEEAALCEILYTFMLCFVVLNVTASPTRGKCPNQYYGLAIGFVVVAGAYGAGAVSGGCFNPAVAFGVDVSSIFLGFGWCFVYTAFELLGAALAAGLFRIVRPEEFGAPVSKITTTQKLTSEFVGTFMLVLTVGLNVLGKSPAGAFSIAAALMSMIYALGDVSGAKFNPAVTVAVLFSGRGALTYLAAVEEILIQILGGLVAAFTYTAVYDGKSFGIGAKEPFGLVQVGFAEFIFTFVLAYVVLCCAVAKETKTSDMFGLAIGSCVTIGGLAIGSISGGSLNPAVSISAGMSHCALGGCGGETQLSSAFAYALVECLGGLAAAGVLKLTHLRRPPKSSNSTSTEEGGDVVARKSSA